MTEYRGSKELSNSPEAFITDETSGLPCLKSTLISSYYILCFQLHGASGAGFCASCQLRTFSTISEFISVSAF